MKTQEHEIEQECSKNEILTNETPVDQHEILRCFPHKFNFILPESSTIPDLIVDGKPKADAMRILAEILGINDYTRNRCSYWMLDVLQEILVEAQRLQMAQNNQITTINWFLFVLKQVQLTVLCRRDFFLNLEAMLRIAEKSMVSSGSELIPTPWEVLRNQGERAFFVYDLPPSPTKHNEDSKEAKPVSAQSRRQASSKRQSPPSSVSKTSEGKSDLTASQGDKEALGELEDEGEFSGMIGPPPITEKDLLIMVQLLYDIFADRLSYEIIRGVYSNAQFNTEGEDKPDEGIAENGPRASKGRKKTHVDAPGSRKSASKDNGAQKKAAKRKSKTAARKSKIGKKK